MVCPHRTARRAWIHEEPLRDEMRREGRSHRFVEDVLAQLSADAHLIRNCMAGALTITAETRAADFNLAPAINFAIQPVYERMVQSKEKTVEGRVCRGVAANVHVGDLLLLGSTRARVTGVTYHSSFCQILRRSGLDKVCRTVHTYQEESRYTMV